MPPSMVGNWNHEIFYLFVNFVPVVCQLGNFQRRNKYDKPQLPPFARPRINILFRLFLRLTCHQLSRTSFQLNHVP